MDGGTKYIVRRKELLYPDLSYQINGALFEVFRQIGGGHDEKYYQKAVAIALKKAGLKFHEQAHVPLLFDGQHVGKYYLDFLVEEKIILELKKSNFSMEYYYLF